jgi:WD40 repeat protein
MSLLKDGKMLLARSGPVGAVAFSPNGQLLAAVTTNAGVMLWEVATGHRLGALQDRKRHVNAIAFSPDGEVLAAASADYAAGPVQIWEVSTGRLLRELADGAHEDFVTEVVFSPDGRMLATVADRIRLWNLATGAVLHTLDGFWTARFSPNGKMLAAVVDGGRLAHFDYGAIRLWDSNEWKAQATLWGSTTAIFQLAFSPGGSLLASRGRPSYVPHSEPADYITIWDLDAAAERLVIRAGYDVAAIAWSPDGRKLATAGSSPDGQGSATTGCISLWEAATGELQQTVAVHAQPVSHIAFSPNGTLVVSSSRDGTVRLWEVTEQRSADAS